MGSLSVGNISLGSLSLGSDPFPRTTTRSFQRSSANESTAFFSPSDCRSLVSFSPRVAAKAKRRGLISGFDVILVFGGDLVYSIPFLSVKRTAAGSMGRRQEFAQRSTVIFG